MLLTKLALWFSNLLYVLVCGAGTMLEGQGPPCRLGEQGLSAQQTICPADPQHMHTILALLSWGCLRRGWVRPKNSGSGQQTWLKACCWGPSAGDHHQCCPI